MFADCLTPVVEALSAIGQSNTCLRRAEYEKGVRADLEARSARMAAREKQIAEDEKEAHGQWSAAAASSAKQVCICSTLVA